MKPFCDPKLTNATVFDYLWVATVNFVWHTLRSYTRNLQD